MKELRQIKSLEHSGDHAGLKQISFALSPKLVCCQHTLLHPTLLCNDGLLLLFLMCLQPYSCHIIWLNLLPLIMPVQMNPHVHTLKRKSYCCDMHIRARRRGDVVLSGFVNDSQLLCFQL